MNKTLRAVVLPLLLFFTLSTVTAPARAILPLVAAGVAMMTEGGLAINGLAALTVGTVAGVVYLGNLQTGAGSEAGSFMEIPLGTSRNRPLTVPPGYTAGATNDSQPVPPNTTAPTFTGYNVNEGGFLSATPQAACLLASSYYDGAVQTGTQLNGYYYFSCTHAGVNQYVNSVPKFACPAGYTGTSTCQLQTASAVQKPPDGRCQILMNVNGFVIDPQDPECGGLAAQTSTTANPTAISFTKNGTLTNGSVTINPDGSRTIVYSSGNTTNNTTTTTTINMTPASNGQTAVVTGSSTVVVNGTGTGAGTAPIAPSAPAIVFPTDYNREATQGQIKTGIDTVHGDLDASGYALPAPPITTPEAAAALEVKKVTDVLDASVASYDNFKLLDWSTWIPVLPAAGCTPFSGMVAGRAVSIDLCPKVALLNELLGWLLSVFALWSVVSMMFRKD